MSSKIKTEKEVLNKQLTALYFLMEKRNDHRNASKILDLYEKYQTKKYTIGFSGHFSAGKSSMINYLLNEDLLPKSPIPTSANIVEVKSGTNRARLYFNNGKYISYQAPYDIELIKEYCKDKETISKIELSSTNNNIPDKCSLFDTPGIDAADDTDRLITESSLHLIDHMIYIVDYNHIQSEVNLLFLQKLQRMKIPYDLVINQIDKHNEQEITFKSLKKSIKQTFDQWALNPCHIYFTSLIDSNLEINELNKFEQAIHSKFNNRKYNLECSLEYVIKEHEHFLQNMHEEQTSNLNLNTSSDEQDVFRLDELKQSINDLKTKPDRIYKELSEVIGQTLKNAYIMPARLRDVARSFLESQEKGFKVGIFNSKKKTDEEKNLRAEHFLSLLTESIEANLKWKLRDKLHQVVKNFHLENEKITNDIQQVEILYTREDLCRLTKEGAKVNGDYVLNYTNEVSNDIKSKYKKQLNQVVNEIVSLATKKYNQRILELEKEYKTINSRLLEHEQLTNMKNTLKEKLTEINRVIDAPNITDKQIKKIEQKIETRYMLVDTLDVFDEPKHKKHTKTNGRKDTLEPDANTNHVNSVDAILTSIDATIQTIEHMSGFESMVKDLENNRNRLTDRQFTIALFGAFSAGKSSFANALIGERLLPTSPNPTTAVINKLAPPDRDNNHGSITIMFKDNATLVEDLYTIVKNVALASDIDEFNDYQNLLNWINEHDIQYNNYLDKTLQSFLQAMVNGYEANKKNVDKVIDIPLEQFESYVTDETIACYIESVTLYYDCSITRKGITLVDTPGADSINARHTNVAFDYIKHADMILYVTYYNHALSRADKNFLLQLGRVKDSFELDKLYFIINAIDLAVDKQEVELVREYVEEQLLELGIRFPKIYALSSKAALEDMQLNKENNDMKQFNSDLFHFIEYELSEVIIQSTIVEMNRVKQTINNYIDTLQLNEQEQEQVKIELLDTQKQAKTIVFELASDVYYDRLKQRIDKQLYYVEERLTIRFHDMFKEKFNPTTVTESGRQAMKQLEFNMNNLVDYVGYELLQEIRAVSLRIESFIRMLLNEANNNVTEQIKKIDNRLILSTLDGIDLDTPEYTQPLTQIDSSELKKPLHLFKGTKAFFEKNEKELMKEEIYGLLSPYINDYLKEINLWMFDSYNQQWTCKINNRKQQIAAEIDTYVTNSLDMMAQPTNMEALKVKRDQLDEIITKMYWKDK